MAPDGISSGFGALVGSPPGHTAWRTPPEPGSRNRSSVPPWLAITASKRYSRRPGSSNASTKTGATWAPVGTAGRRMTRSGSSGSAAAGPALAANAASAVTSPASALTYTFGGPSPGSFGMQVW